MKQNHKTFLTRKRWIGLIVLILAGKARIDDKLLN